MSTRGRACRSHEISGNSRLAPGRIANAANIRRPPSPDAPGLAFRRGSSPPVEPRRPSFDALEAWVFSLTSQSAAAFSIFGQSNYRPRSPSAFRACVNSAA
jgi:hypothetical protein